MWNRKNLAFHEAYYVCNEDIYRLSRIGGSNADSRTIDDK